MDCVACGSDNQDDSQFCRRCGTSLSTTQVTNPAPQELESTIVAEDEPTTISDDAMIETTAVTEDEPVAIADDAMVVFQSQWSYMLYTIPWLILLGFSLTLDAISFGLLPVVVAIYIIGSRYMSFRRTAYILTGEHFIIFRGSFMGRNRIDFPLSNISEVLIQPGIFGQTLGYTSVRMLLADQRVMVLEYVPLTSPLLQHPSIRKDLDS